EATLRSGWLTTGPRTAQFEKEFSAYVRASHAIAVSSCTAGLHLALAALGIGKGDEVITTPLTFCATAQAILHVGARPVLADIGADSSDAVAFSFYATKNMTTGEGGMITTPRDSLAARMRMLSLHGMNRDAWSRYSERGNWYYEVVDAGFKYNLTDIQSAVGIHQLRKLESFIETRTRYAQIYNQALAGMEEVELPPDGPRFRHSWHLYILRLNLTLLKIDRQGFIEELRRKGVGASVHFIPLPLHPFFARLPLAARPCRRALSLYPRIVSLPLYPALTEDQVRYVAASGKEIITSNRTRAQARMTEKN